MTVRARKKDVKIKRARKDNRYVKKERRGVGQAEEAGERERLKRPRRRGSRVA
ncbi:hypothetical protein ALC62_04043 [Cyphomyrmex costatus]|uniref:Uncharacterized protein n=1 Tax=Cyphomyrmex costatus TaxID=456900 RepID=A0A195CWP2_9HYME|nr:hypothetical protein ALC62_04043 [Cyphomyrmex costatus]